MTDSVLQCVLLPRCAFTVLLVVFLGHCHAEKLRCCQSDALLMVLRSRSTSVLIVFIILSNWTNFSIVLTEMQPQTAKHSLWSLSPESSSY